MLIAGCDQPAKTSSLQIPAQGLNFKLEQRNSTTITHLPAELRVEIGDITRGQTLLTVWSGAQVLFRESMQENETGPFSWQNEKLTIECVQLDNELLGPDYGYFCLRSDEHPGTTPASPSALTEHEKIQKLIELTEKSQITFIRNGQDHSAQEAADHLRRKYDYAKDDIHTADQFIQEIASKSSSTGELYYVRMQDGTEVPAGDWFRERLKEVHP